MGKALKELQQLTKSIEAAINAAAKEASDNEVISRLLDSLVRPGETEGEGTMARAVSAIEDRFGERGFVALVELIGAAIEAGKVNVEHEADGPDDSLVRTPAKVDRDNIGGFRIESGRSGESFYISAPY